MEAAARQQVRTIDNTGIKELLYENLERPRRDNVASRCPTCANCTMVPHVLLHFSGRCNHKAVTKAPHVAHQDRIALVPVISRQPQRHDARSANHETQTSTNCLRNVGR